VTRPGEQRGWTAWTAAWVAIVAASLLAAVALAQLSAESSETALDDALAQHLRSEAGLLAETLRGEPMEAIAALGGTRSADAVRVRVETLRGAGSLHDAAQEGKEYEASVTVGERRLDVAFTSDGTWLEEEERVATDALPAPVSAALDARWKGWTVSRAERATTPKGTTYEVVVKSGDRSAEVVLTDAGGVKRVESGDEEEER